jgi:hypothetical protein
MRHLAAVAGLASIIAVTAAASRAQDSVGVGVVDAKPGDAVVIPITAETAQPLNLLSFDVSFDAFLCERIEGVSVVRAGRALAEVQEGGFRCPEEGLARIVFLNLVGGAAIPAGSGLIAEWRFEVRSDAEAGSFPLTVTVNQASNGPIRALVEPFDGQFDIRELPDCAADCNGDRRVAIDELLVAVEIALGQRELADCAPADSDGDGGLVVAELVRGLRAAVDGCPR